MHDLPSQTLLQQAKASPKTGQELEVLGKEAASKYLCGAYGSLNEAVVETVKTAGLSPEQVKRVVEFTNVQAYLEEFKKEAGHKVIQFDGGPANPSDILKDLNDGGGGTVFDRGLGDYKYPPPDTAKTASQNIDRLGEFDTKLAALFQVEDPPLPFAEPLQDSLDLRDKLAGGYDHLNGELGVLETSHMGVIDDLYGHVKQASMEGTSLGSIIQAWSTVADDPVFIKTAFQFISPRLLRDGVFPSKDAIGASIEEMEKTSSLVNHEHPLVKIFQEHCEVLTKLAHTRATVEEIAQGLDTINTFLKAAATKEAEGVIGAIPKVVKAVTGGAARAAKAVTPGAKALLGETAGGLVGGAVKYAPHAAAGLAAEETYQRAKYNPWVRTTYNFMMSRVPYTRANLIRQYRLQQQY